jgi:predicted membrane protein
VITNITRRLSLFLIRSLVFSELGFFYRKWIWRIMCGPTISSVGMYVSLVFIFLISKVLNIVESFLNDVLSTFSL